MKQTIEATPNLMVIQAEVTDILTETGADGLPVVVAINRFGTDSDEEIACLRAICEEKGVDFALSDVFSKGGEGGVELAEKVVAAPENLFERAEKR